MKSLNGTSVSQTTHDSIGVLIIDDHAVVRVGLRLLLADTPGLHLMGEAVNGVEALDAIAKQQPSIILLDLLLHSEHGLDLLPELLQAAPQAHVIILTACQDTHKHRQAISLGARGLVLKTQSVDVLLKAIRRVHAGELWIDRELMHSVIGEMMTQQANGNPEAEKIATLTSRELEIVTQIGEGLKNKQIAERLFISETTVRHHLTSIFGKLEVSDRLELVIYAYRNNLACIQHVPASRPQSLSY